MMDFLTEAKAFEEEMREHRRYLHQHAEVGFDLHDTVTYVKKVLFNMGLSRRCAEKAA